MAVESLQEVVDELAATWGEGRVEEALTRLELALEDEGWNRLGAQSQYDFSRTGLKRIIEIARSMFLANPLIKHGILVQAFYVWGQGFNIVPKAEVIRLVVQAFLDNRGNKREFTGHQARMLKEIALKTDGNIFFALFTNGSTGAVRVRSVPVEQITDVIKNPEDDHEPWYYLREWSEKTLDPQSGVTIGAVKKTYYPDWMYQPKKRPTNLNGAEVRWDAPIYHIRVGGTDHMTYGVPEVYAAMDWARAVVQGLEDYATVRRAQARFAWRFTTKAGPKGVAAGKAKLATTLSSDTNEANPPPVTGATWIQAEGNQLEPIKTAGGQAHPDEGRRVGLMVTSGLGIPETMLFGDSTVGNYATAKSLDRPTELQMRERQTLWADVFGDILGYVIDQAALKPNGPLKGKRNVDKYTGEVTVEIFDPAIPGTPLDRRIDIEFPEILEHDAKDRIQAIIGAWNANGQPMRSGLLDDRTAMRLILTALGQDDVDETIAKLLPDDPNPPAPDDNEPGMTPQPLEPPASVVVPDPMGPVDSPTAAGGATAEALRANHELFKESLTVQQEASKGLMARLGEAIAGLIGVREKEAERPVDVDVQVTLPEQPPVAPPIVNLTVPESKPRRITREAKFHERDGKVIGKTETETEEEIG